MIGLLRGRVIERGINSVILDVKGVGYEVIMPFSELVDCPPSDNEITLFTHLIPTEDAIYLYGFTSSLSRELFRMLINVPGVGARVSLNVLSHINSLELLKAIASGDARILESIKGVGKKTAAKIILELKEKAIKLLSKTENTLDHLKPSQKIYDNIKDDAISALEHLGYSQSEARGVVEKILMEKGCDNLEELIKIALQRMAKTHIMEVKHEKEKG